MSTFQPGDRVRIKETISRYGGMTGTVRKVYDRERFAVLVALKRATEIELPFHDWELEPETRTA